VDANAQAAVHPSGRERFRFGFRAILVFRIKIRYVSERLFWHSHRENRLVLKLAILAHAAKWLRESGDWVKRRGEGLEVEGRGERRG
jgi:hypothetical protein